MLILIFFFKKSSIYSNIYTCILHAPTTSSSDFEVLIINIPFS